MANRNPSTCGRVPQDYLGELSAVFSSLDDSALLVRLQEYRPTGRQGYPLKALWRAYVGSFVLNLPHTNALIRRLEDDADFRTLCGFGALPHRRTFNRFIRRLSHHSDLVEAMFADLTHQLKALVPGLGIEVAVDATTVSQPLQPKPEAHQRSRGVLDGKELRQGQRRRQGVAPRIQGHIVADANYGVPLAHVVTTAKRSDSPELPAVIERTEALYSWFRPYAVIADRGYDGKPNNEWLNGKGIVPIIHIRCSDRDSIYTLDGVPTCLGKIPMEYVRSDPEKGHLYRCKGCHLADSMRGGIRHCDSEVWEDPSQNIRLFGVVRRGSQEWKDLYTKRQAIERVFKSMKESRRLERHCLRGLRQITLHAAMSALTFQATVLVRLRAGEPEWMRWMVRKVA